MNDAQYQLEATFLGAMIINGELIDDCYIEPQELTTDDRHPLILEFLKYANEDESIKTVDILALAKIATENGGGLEKIGGITYLGQLTSSVPGKIQFEYYQKNIRESYLERETKYRMTQLAATIGSSNNIQDHLNRMQEELEQLRDMIPKQRQNTMFKLADLLVGHSDEIERRQEIIGIVGAHTLSKELDKMTDGHQPQKFEIIAARPSVGKTAYALNDADKATNDSETAAIFFSCEMAKEELRERMVSMNSNIDSKKLVTGAFDIDDWGKYTSMLPKLKAKHFYIDDKPGITIEHVRRTTKRMVKKLREQGIKKIIIYLDYLQILRSEKKFKDRQAEVTYISCMCKLIAREFNVTVQALAQLSREVEKRQDKRPMLSDLRESGSLEQDADIVTFLYRDDYYNKQSEKKNIIELIVAKQRGGETGTVEMAFIKKWGKFLDLDHGQRGDAP